MSRNPLNFALCMVHKAPDVPELLYLACPYSHPDSNVRAHRAVLASVMTARLMGMGYAVFSPISHGHAVCEIAPAVGTDADSWSYLNDSVLADSDALVVLALPGCMESVGIRQEVAMAAELGIPVNLVRLLNNTLLVETDVDPTLWADDAAAVGESSGHTDGDSSDEGNV